jgi:glutamine synthetase
MALRSCGEEGPFTRNSLERPAAASIEFESRASHQILGRARDHDFARARLGLGLELVETFLALKRRECDRYRLAVTDWEWTEYAFHS